MGPYHAHCLAQVDKMFSKDARQLSGATKHDEYASATSSFVEGAVHFWSDAPYIRGGYTSPHASFAGEVRCLAHGSCWGRV